MRCNFGGKGYRDYRGTIGFDGEKYAAASPARPCNFLSWDDAMAFADWCALRPMTELEFEKACRGNRKPVANEFPWGKADKLRVERRVNADGDLAHLGGKPESELSAKTMAEFGASQYWVMDLAGSLWERCITVGDSTGRAFKGTHGDGIRNWLLLPFARRKTFPFFKILAKRIQIRIAERISHCADGAMSGPEHLAGLLHFLRLQITQRRATECLLKSPVEIIRRQAGLPGNFVQRNRPVGIVHQEVTAGRNSAIQFLPGGFPGTSKAFNLLENSNLRANHLFGNFIKKPQVNLPGQVHLLRHPLAQAAQKQSECIIWLAVHLFKKTRGAARGERVAGQAVGRFRPGSIDVSQHAWLKENRHSLFVAMVWNRGHILAVVDQQIIAHLYTHFSPAHYIYFFSLGHIFQGKNGAVGKI